MRYQGKISSWDRTKGFGFIAWNGGNDRVFAHINALTDKHRIPAVGDVVTYEVSKDEKGRFKATKVTFTQAISRNAASKRPLGNSWFRRITLALTLSALGFGLYLKQKPKQPTDSNPPVATPLRAPSTETSGGSFTCAGKTHCSEMTSCAEATFYIEHCPNTQMDGDGDGVPCESQWCQ